MSDINEGIEVGLDSLSVNGDPKKLYEELAKAQAKFTPVPKGSQGQIGNQSFKYAGYATLMRCIRPALTEHGISILQPLHSRNGKAITTTILAGHGASIQSSFAFKAEFTKKFKDGTIVDDPQEFGRHHTYYRRYQLQAMLGIEGDRDADDLPDVNEAAQYVEPEVAAKPPKASKPKESSAKDSSAKESAVESPAAAEPKTSVSVVPSEPLTNGHSAEVKPTEAKPEVKPEPKVEAKAKPLIHNPKDTRTMNEKLQEGMKQLGWKMPEVKAFFKQHIDPAGFDKADNLSLEQKMKLFETMVTEAGVIPF